METHHPPKEVEEIEDNLKMFSDLGNNFGRTQK